MKKIIFHLILISISLLFACNDGTFLELPEEKLEVNCNNVYDELSNIRIDKIGKSDYKYEVIDGKKKLVEIYDGSSYITLYYSYQGGHLQSIKRYDRLSETFESLEEFIYDGGFMVRKNYFPLDGDRLVEEFMSYTTYKKNEQNRIIERKTYWVEDGVEKFSSHTTFEWDDCNLIKLNDFDKNGTLGSTSNFFYDDKANPYNLISNLDISARKSANNLIRVECTETNNPDYLGASKINSGTSEYFYSYNEFNLPIQRTYDEFGKVDYTYLID